ncbi:hypothetical protein RFI_14471 [Reticulomyxa filosa]|uniref:RGS domain-containing protein n=1 Tax=Reticulomyxa filosa TaxID=46433 RepID=X6NBL9_RETFI|nr:hypothetical protein RFI_14471 [Reticulomyxa filosa]|eukprot:ETO22722.1 hypothetical protein RFI_14471 [Reticulomyxa filosa]
MAQEIDDTKQIITALENPKDREILVALCKKKYMNEVTEFLTFHEDYLKTKDLEKKKDKAQRILFKFLTLDGELEKYIYIKKTSCCLPDYVLLYKNVYQKIKRLEKSNEEFPDNLFQEAYNKVLLTIKQEIWGDFLDSKKLKICQILFVTKMKRAQSKTFLNKTVFLLQRRKKKYYYEQEKNFQIKQKSLEKEM